MQEQPLKNSFVTIDEAIEIINSDTRKNPVVDITKMVNSLPHLRERGNFRIPLLTRDETGKIVKNGSRFTTINSSWDKSRLEHAIVEHYKVVDKLHRTINPEEVGLKSLTTAIDDDKNTQGRLRVNDKPMTKYGDNTNGGSQDIKE